MSAPFTCPKGINGKMPVHTHDTKRVPTCNMCQDGWQDTEPLTQRHTPSRLPGGQTLHSNTSLPTWACHCTCNDKTGTWAPDQKRLQAVATPSCQRDPGPDIQSLIRKILVRHKNAKMDTCPKKILVEDLAHSKVQKPTSHERVHR